MSTPTLCMMLALPVASTLALAQPMTPYSPRGDYIHFDGNDDYCDLPTALFPNRSFTIEFGFRVDPMFVGEGTLFQQGYYFIPYVSGGTCMSCNETDPRRAGISIRVYRASAMDDLYVIGSISGRLGGFSTSINKSVVDTIDDASKWHHVAFVFDRSIVGNFDNATPISSHDLSGTLRLYIDGIDTLQTNTWGEYGDGTTMVNNNGNCGSGSLPVYEGLWPYVSQTTLGAGRYNSETTDRCEMINETDAVLPIKGDIDEFRIWTEPRTASDISGFYNRCLNFDSDDVRFLAVYIPGETSLLEGVWGTPGQALANFRRPGYLGPSRSGATETLSDPTIVDSTNDACLLLATEVVDPCNQCDPCDKVDLAPPYGTLNFADIQVFLTNFGMCGGSSTPM